MKWEEGGGGGRGREPGSRSPGGSLGDPGPPPDWSRSDFWERKNSRGNIVLEEAAWEEVGKTGGEEEEGRERGTLALEEEEEGEESSSES